MATPVKETPVDKIATRASTSISGPAYKVTVGGTARGKPRRYTISTTSQKTVIEEYHVVPRYLKPSTGSCHDSCKHGADDWTELGKTRRLGVSKKYTMSTSRYLKPKTASCHDSCKHGKNETTELKTTRSLASRKRSVTKSNGVKRTVVTVERKKITGTKPKPSQDSKTRAPGNELKIHTRVKTKPMTVKPSSSTVKSKKVTKVKTTKRVSPRKDQHMMTKTKLRQLIADRLEEMTLQEAEVEEVSVEVTVQSPEILTNESTIVENTEEVLNEDSSESASKEQVTESEVEDSNEHVAESEQVEDSNEQVAESKQVEDSSEQVAESEQVEDSNEQVAESKQVEDSNEQVQDLSPEQAVEEELLKEEFEYNEEGYILEEEEDDDATENDDGKPGRSRIARSDGKDGHRKVRFRKGRELDVDEEAEAEKVNLKQTEVGKKAAKELLNSMIEETASKLARDRKKKVEALVGAFETVISTQEDETASP